MHKNIDWDAPKFNEILPRCMICKYHELEVIDDAILHYCKGELIFPETLDVCSEEDFFKER